MKLLLLLAMLLCLIGCRADTPPMIDPIEEATPATPYDLYIYTDDNRYLAVGSDGNVVLEVTDGQMGLLRTDGDLSAIAVVRSEGVTRDEYGWAEPERIWCDIYDPSGRFEYALPLNYVSQYGNFLTGYSAQTESVKLYRRTDGRLLYDDVSACFSLGNYLYVNQNDWSAPGMFLDQDGEIVFRVPDDYTSAGCIFDTYLIVSQNGLSGLMRPDGTLAVPCLFQQLHSGQQSCVIVKDESGWHAMEVETGNVLFTSPTRIQFLLPQAAIVAVDEREDLFRLITPDGTAVMDTVFSWPNVYDVNQDGAPELFSATVSDPQRTIFFNADGVVLHESEHDCYATPLSESTVLFNQYQADIDQHIWYWMDLDTGELTRFSETSDSTYYNLLYSDSGAEEGLLCRSGSNSQGWYRTDILDPDGNVLLDDLQDMIYRGDGIFQCSRGFTSGLLRLDGTWLYQQSSFSTLTDD